MLVGVDSVQPLHQLWQHLECVLASQSGRRRQRQFEDLIDRRYQMN